MSADRQPLWDHLGATSTKLRKGVILDRRQGEGEENGSGLDDGHGREVQVLAWRRQGASGTSEPGHELRRLSSDLIGSNVKE